MKKEVGLRIKRIRDGLNLSRDEVADQLKMSNGNYSKIERGDVNASVTVLAAIAKILKVSVAEFFQDKKSQELEDPIKQYGLATKSDIEDLAQTVKELKQEIEKLKNENGRKRKPVSKKRK